MNTHLKTDQKIFSFSWPSVGLAIFLLSSNAAQVIRGSGLPSNLGHLALLTGIALLWLNRLTGSPEFLTQKTPKKYFTIIFFISFSAMASAIYAFGLSNQNQVLIKTGGLILTLWTLYSCVGSFSLVALQSALGIYAVAELGFLLLLPQADWNPNAFAARTITASLIGFYFLPKNHLRYAALAIGISLALMSQCRTAALAGLLGFAFSKYTTLFEKHATLSATVLLITFLFLSLFSQDLSTSGKKFLKDSIGGEDIVTQFFLSDKTAEILDNDMFDRRDQWNAAIKVIKKHPFFGVGFGNEFSMLDNSTHSAYLTIVVKYGLVGLTLWVIFYLQIVKDIFKSKSAQQRQLKNVTKFFFGYLCIASIFESSGFGSISTPMNITLLLLAFWLSINSHPTVNLET